MLERRRPFTALVTGAQRARQALDHERPLQVPQLHAGRCRRAACALHLLRERLVLRCGLHIRDASLTQHEHAPPEREPAARPACPELEHVRGQRIGGQGLTPAALAEILVPGGHGRSRIPAGPLIP